LVTKMPIYLQIGPPKIGHIKLGSIKGDFRYSLDEKLAIKGSSTEPSHQNWLPLESCEYGPSKYGRVRCTRRLDASSIAISKLSQSGSDVAATIDFSKAYGSGAYMRLKLSGAAVSAYTIAGSQAGASQGGPMETFDLAFDDIYVTYNPIP